MALLAPDRLLIRDVQLAMAQAHIDRLQSELKVKDTEVKLGALLQSLKTQYTCLDCELQADFTWKRTPAVAKPGSPASNTTPAPPKASGQTSKE